MNTEAYLKCKDIFNDLIEKGNEKDVNFETIVRMASYFDMFLSYESLWENYTHFLFLRKYGSDYACFRASQKDVKYLFYILASLFGFLDDEPSEGVKDGAFDKYFQWCVRILEVKS